MLLCSGHKTRHYLPAGEVTWGHTHGITAWNDPSPHQVRGFHKGHSLSNIYNQDDDWKQFVHKIEKIDNKAESAKARKELEKAKAAAEAQMGGRHYRVPEARRSLRKARETLMRTAPALEGPRLTDVGTSARLSNILKDRYQFHSFEEQLRMSMEKAIFFKRAQSVQQRVQDMIYMQQTAPGPALRRGRTSPGAIRLKEETGHVKLGPLSHNALAHSGMLQPWIPGQPLPPRKPLAGAFYCGVTEGSKLGVLTGRGT